MQSISLSSYSNGVECFQLINQRMTTRLHGSTAARQKSQTNSEQLPVGQAPEVEGDFQEQPSRPQWILHEAVNFWIWDSWPVAAEAGTLIAVQRLWKPQVGAKQGPMIDQRKVLACKCLQRFKKVKELMLQFDLSGPRWFLVGTKYQQHDFCGMNRIWKRQSQQWYLLNPFEWEGHWLKREPWRYAWS